MKVLVLAEYYPRAENPALGIWAHRQSLAARDAGAEVRVLVLYRPLPPLATLRKLDLRGVRRSISQPGSTQLDGLQINYLRYLSPPRPWSYGSWGAWAAPVLRQALGRLRASFPFELVHAHYAVPAGDAVRRAAAQSPLVVSVHGGDVHGDHANAGTVRATLAHARLVLANSAGTARRCTERGALRTRVIHLGTDLPTEPTRGRAAGGTGAAGGGDARPAGEGDARPAGEGDARPAGGGDAEAGPTLVTVADLVARKRHADVLRALAVLRERHPGIRYVVVGDGPERDRLQKLATSLGVERLVRWCGPLAHPEAVASARAGSLFVLPSVEEAFGVAYVEAMGGGVPVVGCRDEDGPQEIAAHGGGIALVPPRDPRALAAQIDALLSDPARLAAMGREARLTVEREFTWQQCGRQTVQAYHDVLGA
jgi:teichuronic acid biosynthesis glycosyltransferase TuaC